jgi:lysozyme
LTVGDRYGIDASAHQGEIDRAAMAGDDIEFACLTATEGDDFTDRRFAVNWMGAQRAGVQRGAYHFLSLCSSSEARARHRRSSP